MKKLLAIVLCMFLILGTCSCQRKKIPGESINDIREQVQSGESTASKFDENAIRNGLVIEELTWYQEYGGNYVGLIIKNTTDQSFFLMADMIFKDASGSPVETDSNTATVCGNSEVCLVFNSENAYASYEFKTDISSPFFVPETANMTCEPSTDGDTAYVKMTNNGPNLVVSTSGYVLFYLGEQVVHNSFFYIQDIGPGQSQSSDVRCFTNYDSVRFFYSSYSEKPN